MAAANPLWGAPRIHGELLKLGLDVSERTVSRFIPKRRPQPSQTWGTFLANHVRDLVSLDFFTVPTVRLRVLFVLVVLAHHRRRRKLIPRLRPRGGSSATARPTARGIECGGRRAGGTLPRSVCYRAPDGSAP